MFAHYNGTVYYVLQAASDYIMALSPKGETFIPMSEINLIYDITFNVYYSTNIIGVKNLWEIPLEYGNVRKDTVTLVSDYAIPLFKHGGDNRYRRKLPLKDVSILADMQYHMYGGKVMEYRVSEPIPPDYFHKVFSEHLNAKEGRIVGPSVTP